MLQVVRMKTATKYLKDIKNGDYFETSTLKGIKLNSGPMGTRVIILSAEVEEEDQLYYLGKHLIANETEVRR